MSSQASLFEQLNQLPPIPKVVRDLITAFEEPEVDVDRVSTLVSADPLLTTRLLRMANSAFYRRSGSVNRVQDAVIFLGMNTVRNMVLASGMSASVRFPANFPSRPFWRYCLHTAVASRYLARNSRLDSDVAFTIGLIRAIGEPLIYGALGDEAGAVDAMAPFYDRDRASFEHQRFGLSFIELGAELANRWHFPEAMTAALRQSQAPQESDPSFRMAGVVQLGAWIAGDVECGDTAAPEPATVRLMQRLGVPLQVLIDMPPLAQLSEGLESLVAA